MTKISEAVQSPSERSKFAYKVMLAFSFLYYLRPSDVIPGLRMIPLAKITGAVAILALLTIIFIIASAVARIRGIDISCGCFGHLSNHLSFAWHLGLDTVLLALLFALWRSKHLRRAITV